MNEDLTKVVVETIAKKRNSFGREVLETLRFIAIALVVVIPIRYFVAQPFIVSGASMDPTFTNGQYLIIDELSYKIGEPSRGDIVVFKYPNDTSKYFIKRVIGLPGETIDVNQSGQVSIKSSDGKNAFILEEPYIEYPKNDSIERTLAKDEYFVMGDNRAGSFDSRIWGPVPRNLIIGKAFLRLFPISTLSIFPGQFRQK
ncbi:MAG: signal peptidase I [Candidatus Pacebacteria bacterium]|nr:signal peptidase I [Candidatus Paceibacterota bacterium]